MAEETEVLQVNLPHAALLTTDSTWLNQGSNPGYRGGKPATSRQSYGTACSVFLLPCV
jgi:hypothetical protein